MNIEKLIENNLEMDGIVIRINDTNILFLLHYDNLLDGIRVNLQNSESLRDDQFSHVHVTFEKKNYYVDHFFGYYDYTIKTLSTYSVNSDGSDLTIMKIIKDGEFEGVVRSALKS